MFKRNFSPLFLIFCLIPFFHGCQSGAEKATYETILVEGAQYAFNLSTSYAYFGAYAEEMDTLALPVSDGDLLYLSIGDAFFYLRYKDVNGKNLSFSIDTVDHWMYDRSGNLVVLILDDTFLPDKVKNLNISTLKSLQTLYVPDSLSEAFLPVIDKIASASPNVGLVMEQKVANDYVLSRLSPSWLFAPAEVLLSIKEKNWGNLENVELLFTDDLDSVFTSRLPPFPNLKSLIVGEDGDIITGLDYLKKLDKLQSLTLVESGITNLDFLESMPQLKKLYLIDCDSLEDISGLRFLKELNSLSFLVCDSIPNPGMVSTLPSLKYFSGPINLDQKTFDEIILTHTGLQVLEIPQQEKIKNLSSLVGLKALKSLSLFIEIKDLSPLNDLENLEVLLFNSDEWDGDEAQLEAFKAANPDVKVVPGGGFCLGSGWLLLLIPLILITRFVFFQRKFQKTNLK